MNSKNLNSRIKDFEHKQRIISVIAFFAFCGLAIIFNNIHLTSMAQESTKYISRFISIGDHREVTLVLQQAHLSNFKIIRYNSKIDGNSFVIPAKAAIESRNSFIDSLLYDKVDTPVASNVSNLAGDSITYEFNRFRLIPYAMLAWIIILLISIPQTRFLKRKLTEQFEKDLEVEKKMTKAEIAAQVRHNLRTPLAALMRIPQKLPNSKDKELLEIILKQFQDLVGRLDFDSKPSLAKENELRIYDTLLSSKQELQSVIPKNIDFSFEIEDMVSSSLVNHIPFELRSILANIVTNSIEAINGKGKISIQTTDKITELEVKISDTGCGIPVEVLPKIFEKNFSHNKEKGTGIGLSHAKEFIEKWRGTIKVNSSENVGTTVTISLPVQDKESWYTPRLKIQSNSKIYILDDQESALSLWRLKFSEDLNLLNRVRFYNDHIEFLKDLSCMTAQDVFLIDYDLGSTNGLKVMENLPKTSLRCLVTGHFDDQQIRQNCTALDVFLIPKSFIHELTIV